MFDHTVINKHKLSAHTIKKSTDLRDSNKHDDCEFVLQGAQIIMMNLMRDQGLSAVSQSNSSNGEPNKDWKDRLARVVKQNM